MKTLKRKEKLSKQLFNVEFKGKKESDRGGEKKKKERKHLNLKPYKIKAI